MKLQAKGFESANNQKIDEQPHEMTKNDPDETESEHSDVSSDVSMENHPRSPQKKKCFPRKMIACPGNFHRRVRETSGISITESDPG